jgi:phosphohistidine phosphatase
MPSEIRRREVAMELYLMQHGESAPESEDPARPLTEAGRAAVQLVVARARAAGVHIERCLHSGKLRAEQTAQLLADAVGTEHVKQRDGLAPKDEVAPIAEWLRTYEEADSLAIVGHLPFLDRLTSVLVTEDDKAQVVRFQMGGLVKLVPKESGDGFLVAWVLVPDLA